MPPSNLKTKIFLDSGDPAETREAIKLLGFLDGQTTNPTLVARNPEVKARLEKGQKFTEQEIYDFYRTVAVEISNLIPDGSVSLEVYADDKTSAQEMIKQGQEMFAWIPNAHVKLPITSAGLEAANQLTKDGKRVNMTLCFTQAQAGAVYSATQGAGSGDVFVSPFVGRLDDLGLNGIDLIGNIARMFKSGDHHVKVLSASVRTFDHFSRALALRSDIITAPIKILKEWANRDLFLPDDGFVYQSKNLKNIPYQDLNLDQPWREFDIKHQLTDSGIERFSADWQELIK